MTSTSAVTAVMLSSAKTDSSTFTAMIACDTHTHRTDVIAGKRIRSLHARGGFGVGF